MILTMLLNAALVTIVASLVPKSETGFRCGVRIPTRRQVEAHRALASLESTAHFNSAIKRVGIAVDLYVHVVSSTKRGTDNVSDSVIQRQVNVLNDNYSLANISFNFRGTTRTANRDWANNINELAMKNNLRRGGIDTLNLYFLDHLEDNAYGSCTFLAPISGPDDQILDGCLVKATTAPGSSEGPYNMGKTATHEVGHWFGLLHTFESHSSDPNSSGCDGPGDYVSDTPASKDATWGCPSSRDSCPASGFDPIHNYMDYSDDICYAEFSNGQISRMHRFWNKYRKRDAVLQTNNSD